MTDSTEAAGDQPALAGSSTRSRMPRLALMSLLFGKVVLAIVAFWQGFGLVNELQQRSAFEQEVEKPLLAQYLNVSNVDNAAKLYLRMAQELEAIENAADHNSAPSGPTKSVAYVQHDLQALNAAVPEGEASPSDEPAAVGEGEDVTDQITGAKPKVDTSQSKTSASPSYLDYGAAVSRALDAFRADLNLEKIKVDRYATYLSQRSYRQGISFQGWSSFGLTVGILLWIGAFAGSIGGLINLMAGNYIDSPPPLREFLAIALRPLFGGVVAILSGYCLVYVATGILPAAHRTVLSIPVTVYGFAFLLAVNPYNSMMAVYAFLRSQTQAFVLMGAEDADERRKTSLGDL